MSDKKETEITLTENDMKVMANVSDKDTQVGFSKSKGSTIEEIYLKVSDTMSESKVRNALYKLVDLGYIGYGVKKEKKKTYHITIEGIDYMKKIRIPSIKIK